MVTSPVGKVKRQPDAGVANAIIQMQRNKKFKRMLMFGLRSLSSLCTPPTNRYKENAMAALDDGVVSTITEAIKTDSSDEDCGIQACKILWGMTEGLKEQADAELNARFVTEGGIDTLVLLLNAGAKDELTLELIFKCIQNIADLDIQINVPLVNGLIKCLHNKPKPKIGLQFMTTLAAVVSSSAEAAVYFAQQGVSRLLDYCLELNPTDKDVPILVENALRAVKTAATTGKTSPENLDSTMKLVDLFKGRKNIVERGSAAMAAMMGPQQLKKCLNTLSTSPNGSEERKTALIMLSSMSYIAAYAEAIVKAGSLPLLCDALAKSADDIARGRTNSRIVSGLIGACKMLATVANDPRHLRMVEEAGGLKAVLTALNGVKDKSEAAAACCAALEPMSYIQPLASHMVAKGAVPIIINLMQKNPEDSNLIELGAAVLAGLSTHPSIARKLSKTNVILVLTEGMKVSKSENFQLNCVNLLEHISVYIQSSQSIRNAGTLDAVVKAVKFYSNNRSLAHSASELFARLSSLSDASSIAKPCVVDALLSMMLSHPDTTTVQDHCKAALEVFSADEDVSRSLADLEKALMAANRHPERAFQALASVVGLSQIARLRSIFEKQDAAATVMKGINMWISGRAFKDYQRMISAGITCIHNLKRAESGSLDAVIEKLLQSALAPQMNAILEKQEPLDNSALDILKAVQSLAALNRIETEDGLSAIVDAVLKLMKKFTDIRQIQVFCIDILNEIVATRKDTSVLSQTGALKIVLSYMQKVAMYTDVQISGFRLLSNCLNHDASVADIMRRNGAIEVIKAAIHAYGKNEEVKYYLAPVLALLIPEDELEKEVQENSRAIQKGTLNEDVGIILKSMRCMVQLTLSPAGSRCAARLGVARDTTQVIPTFSMLHKSKKLPTAEFQDLLCESLVVMRNLSETRMGCSALLKAHCIGTVSTCISELMGASDCEAKKEGLENCGRILRNLIRSDRLNGSELAINEGVVPRMQKLMNTYADDPALFGAACGAIAAIRHQQSNTSPEYQFFLDRIVAGIETGERDKRLQCLTALEDLFIDPDLDIMECLMKKKAVNALFKAMGDFADDHPSLCRTQRCMKEISKDQRTSEKWLKESEGTGLPMALAVTKRILKNNKADADTCATGIKILRRYCQPIDKSTLQQSGIVADIEELIPMHPDNQALLASAGSFFGNMGCDELINNLMNQIIDCVAKEGPDWPEHLAVLCNQLAVYLNSDIENPHKAFATAQQCVDALACTLKGHPDASATAAVLSVARRLVDKFWDNDEAIYGAQCIRPKMMPEIVSLINDRDITTFSCRNKKPLCNGLRTLAACLIHPKTRLSTLNNVCQDGGLLPKCDELLKMYANEPEVTAHIFNFLSKIALDEAGANKLLSKNNINVASRNIGEDFVNDVSLIMTRNRKHSTTVQAGMELLGNLISNGNPLSTSLTSSHFIKNLELVADSSAEALAAHMQLQSRFIGKLSNDDCCSMVKRTICKWNNMQVDPKLSADKKTTVGTTLVKMIGEFAEAGLRDELKKSGAVDAVVQILQENNKSLPITRAVIGTCKILAEDKDTSAKLLCQNGNLYVKDCLALVDGDALASHELMDLLNTICDTEGNGRILSQNEGFKNLIETIGMTAANTPGIEGQALKDCMTQLLKTVEPDNPEVLTLEKVFSNWSARQDAGLTLNLGDATTVVSHFDFVCEHTEQYSKEKHNNLDTELGSEFMYGCKCFSLLHRYPENSKFCIENKEPAFMISAIKRQKNEHVDQYPIRAAADACQHRECAEAFCSVNESALIISDALRRGRFIPGVSNAKREEMLIPRLLLVERVAFERMYFNNTDCMIALIGLWNDYDAGKYTTILLRHVFRAMRQIVNDHFVPIIVKNEVPKRLIDVVNKKDADLELLPDVLFLLGTLAVVPQIKTMIGDLKGIEACLELLRRCLKNTKDCTTRVQTNACLALANITIGHGPNIARFTNAKGQDLNIEVMQKSMAKTQDYDVSNGASILMCNTCFKRDDQKEIYGKKGGPQAVMNTIKKYDGSDDTAALRCLSSMFKAIGNLALYPPNVVEFLDGGIDQTLVHFYSHCENTPDTLIETSLKTVSNLVLENTEGAMIRFGSILGPLLKMLQQGNRDTVSMLSMCFETLGCLCRLPANAHFFAKKEGIETVLKILNNECDESLYANGIFVLGIQTTNVASVDILVDNDVFNFIVALFEQQIAKIPNIDQEFEGKGAMVTDLVVSGLRCVRRLLRNGRVCSEFVNAGGLNVLCSMLGKTNDHAMIHLECYRVLINLLELNQPPELPKLVITRKTRNNGEWDAQVSDEGVLPALALAERPPSPRAWESMGIHQQQISGLIVNISTLLVKEENKKSLHLARFGLGLLAYFACEKIDGIVDSFYNGSVATAIEVTLENFEADMAVIQTSCYIINNVAFASDQSMYALLRKEKKMRLNLDYAIKRIPKVEKDIKDFCLLTVKLLAEKSLDPTRFEIHHQWEYPLKLTQWDSDPYPNGVQDLPLNIREEIRAGGKFKVLVDGKTKEIFHWKASFNMLFFQWRIDAREGPFTHSVPTSRIKTISGGLTSETFKRAAERMNGVNRLNENLCCVLSAPHGDDLPESVELNIVCGSKKARDRFVALMAEWRDAAIFGF